MTYVYAMNKDDLYYTVKIFLSGDTNSVDNFIKWGFGTECKKIATGSIPDLWNKIHGNQLKVYSTSRADYLFPHMIQLWKTETENKK